MNPINYQALIEGAKELGRIVVIAGVSAGIVYLQAQVGGIHNPTEQLVLGTALTSFVKAIDKYIHMNSNINANGIVPF